MSRRPGFAVLTVLLAVSLFAGPAHAGLDVWTGTGPAGGPIRSVLVDPVTPSTIYVGTVGSGVFKSTDSGATWNQTDPTGPLAARTVRALVVDNLGTLYAGSEDAVDAASGGVFVSANAGQSWTEMSTGLTNKKVQALVFDGTTLYAGTREETVGSPAVTVTGGVFAWNGSTWTQINNGLSTQSSRRVQAFAVDPRPLPANPAVIYAGTQGDAVYKTVDGGATWTQLPIAGFSSDCLLNPEILSLVVDTTIQVETLYAGATGTIGNSGCGPTPSQGGHRGIGAGLFRFSASALPPGWDRRMSGDFELLLPTTLSTSVWAIAMNGANIYAGTDVGVLRSNDGTGSWNLLPPTTQPSGFVGLPVRALGIDPTGTLTLYAGTNGRGMFKRSPPNNQPSVGQQGWTAASVGLGALRASAVALGARDGLPVVIAGLSSAGLITSSDDGATWDDTAETSRTVRDLSADPTSPSTVYAATVKGVLKTQNGGDTWTSASVGLPTTTTQDPNDPTPPRTVAAIMVDPAHPNTVYAGVGGVFRSVDNGATWVALNGTAASLPGAVTTGDGTVAAFAVDHGAGTDPTWGTLYVGTNGSGVYKTADGGATWVQAVNGIPVGDQSVVALVADPLVPSTLYAGTSTGKVFKTTNGGTSWSTFGSGLPGNGITSLVIDLGAPGRLFAGLDGAGVYCLRTNGGSCSGGGSWTSLNSGLGSLNVAGLALDATEPGTLYAATLGRGVFDYEFDAGATQPVVFLNSPAPPYPVTVSSSTIQLSGTTSAAGVFWSTNRGHAGFALLTAGNWSASVPLETGSNLITVTGIDINLNQATSVPGPIEVILPDVAHSLTALSPAMVWVGLTITNTLGVRYDLQAEVLVGAIVIATGQVNDVKGGFSNTAKAAKLNSIPLTLSSGPVNVPPGSVLSIRVLARTACAQRSNKSVAPRFWFNGKQQDAGFTHDTASRFGVTIGGVSTEYFLRDAFVLDVTAGAAHESVDASATAKCAPFAPFGTWSITLQ